MVRRFSERPSHVFGRACRHAAAAAVLLLVAGTAAAQPLQLGVRAGINRATVGVEDAGAIDPSSRWAPVGGAFVHVDLPGPVDAQGEVLYSGKGARVDQENLESELRVDYLEVPLLARVALPGQAYAVGGGAFAVRLRARSRIAFDGGVEELDVDDRIERLDVGIVAGLGVSVGRLIVDGRLTWGLTDLDRSQAAAIRNRVVSITAGIGF